MGGIRGFMAKKISLGSALSFIFRFFPSKYIEKMGEHFKLPESID